MRESDLVEVLRYGFLLRQTMRMRNTVSLYVRLLLSVMNGSGTLAMPLRVMNTIRHNDSPRPVLFKLSAVNPKTTQKRFDKRKETKKSKGTIFRPIPLQPAD